MEKKNKLKKSFSFLRQMDLKMLQNFASVKNRILVIGTQWVNKKS